MEQKTQTRKEREREFKRQEILDAAIHIFAKKGFKATTLDEIAEKAEFGKGTLYNYFSSKEDIYKGIISSTLAENKKNFLEAEKTSDTLYDFILETTKRQISFCLNNKDAFLLLVFTKMHHAKSISLEVSKLMQDNEKEMIGHIIEKTEIAVANKEIRKLDAEKTIRLFKSSGFAYIYDLVMSQNLKEENVDDEALFITDILFNGINFK
jgi:AcrR family transcriptional regulator